MERNIRAIFFDVDGTLLSHKSNEVPAGTRRALARLRARGIKTVVATGRQMYEFNKLPISDIDFDGYLTLNGNLMLDENKKVYAGTPIDKGETKGTIPEVGSWHGEDVYQVLAFVPAHEKKILDDLLDECAVTSWNDTGIDIIPRGGGKSAGIHKFMEEYGIERSEIMAFGDGENDIDMLQFAGIGVAMGNAGDKVKAAADYVTDSVDANGIENALRHFGLL